MLKRKLQYNNSIQSYFLVPKQIAEALRPQKWDMMVFELIENKITLTPEGKP